MPHVEVRGLRTYYERHGPETGTPVVLVVGLGGDVTAWGFQLAALAPTRPCVVFDNRGAGRTEAPDAPFTVRDMAGDLLGLLDALGLDRVHLLGLSMGGAIAQEAALAAPDRVASLQLHATWPGLDPYLRAVTRAACVARRQIGREAFLRILLPWLFTPACYATRPELVEMVLQQALATPHPQPLHGYLRQAEAVMDHDARGRLHQIRCPTLVSVGTEDMLTPLRLARELATLIPGARLEVIPGAGHGALWEAPAAFNALCLAFLERVDPGRAG